MIDFIDLIIDGVIEECEVIGKGDDRYIDIYSKQRKKLKKWITQTLADEIIDEIIQEYGGEKIDEIIQEHGGDE